VLPIKGWRIYYADGSVFTDLEGSWAEAPPFGVQAIVYYHMPEGTTMTMDRDIYEYLGTEAGGQPFKMGLWTDGESYWRVHDAVTGEVTP
jgi:hypothetical protein